MATPPGPTPTPLLGHLLAFRRNRLGFLQQSAREHGDVVGLRLGPYRVTLLAHPDHVRDVLVTRQHAFRKSPVLQRAGAVLGTGLLTSEGETHRRHRRIVQAAFRRQRIAAYAREMTAAAGRTADRWRAGETVDVHREMVRGTLEVAGTTLFDADVAEDVSAVESGLAAVLGAYNWLFVPFAALVLRLPFGPQRTLESGRAQLDGVVRRMIARRHAQGEGERERAGGRGSGGSGQDLLSTLLAGDGVHGQLSDDEIRDEVLTLLLAGHETTANALTFAWHLLAQHPEAEERLHAEVDEATGGQMPTIDHLERLPYTRSVLAETMRLYPPAWTVGRQALAEYEVGGYRLPIGSVVLLSQWVVHRDPRWWPEPERFDPDRWQREPDRQKYAYFPFGAGARQCIGESFAWTEGVLTLATVASRWRLRPTHGGRVELQPLITLRPRAEVWMTPHRRHA